MPVVKKDPLKSCCIFFAIPCFGGNISHQCFLGFLQLVQVLSEQGIPYQITTLGNQSLISRARNILTSMFLENKNFTHLMFIDADIQFKPEDVLKLISADKDVVGAAYPKKIINWDEIKQADKTSGDDLISVGASFVGNLEYLENGRDVKMDNGVLEAHDVGSGFMLIKREVVEKIIKSYPDFRYTPGEEDGGSSGFQYALFDPMIDPKSNKYLPEDFAFCRKWQQIGGQTWIEPTINLRHIGNFIYEGDYLKSIQSEK